MHIIAISPSTVEVEDEASRERSRVFLQDNGVWKCLRCMRKRCAHVKWVQSQNITPLPVVPPSIEELADLIDE